jgi:predicted nucleotidyltransferase
MVAMNDMQAVVNRIAEAYDPDRVVLSGSHARGTPASDSDVEPLAIRGRDCMKEVARDCRR